MVQEHTVVVSPWLRYVPTNNTGSILDTGTIGYMEYWCQ